MNAVGAPAHQIGKIPKKQFTPALQDGRAFSGAEEALPNCTKWYRHGARGQRGSCDKHGAPIGLRRIRKRGNPETVRGVPIICEKKESKAVIDVEEEEEEEDKNDEIKGTEATRRRWRKR